MEERKDIQVIAGLALLEGREEAQVLGSYLTPAHAEIFRHAVDGLQSVDISERLQALRAQEDFSGIAEIHPAWLLEILKKESPRVIGVVLRHLPSKHVRYLLEHLPKRITMELPKLVEAFYVPTEVLGVVRRRVERHFVPMRISHQIDLMTFSQLYFLKIEELECLCYDLGLSELALSLMGATKEVLKIVLNRFMIREAKEVLKRIKMHSTEQKWFLQDARYSVLELGRKELGCRRFLDELGLMAMAKGVREIQADQVEALWQKMAPEKAYLFKRYLDESRQEKNLEKKTKRQNWVLEHVRRLSEEGLIDSFWKECFRKEAA